MTGAYLLLRKYSYKHGSSAVKTELDRRRHSPGSRLLGVKVGEHELFYCLTPNLLALIEEITLRERELAQSWAELPLPSGEYLKVNLSVTEALSTVEIEGVRSTRQEMAQALLAGDKTTGGKPPKYAGNANPFTGLTKLLLNCPDNLPTHPGNPDKNPNGEPRAENPTTQIRPLKLDTPADFRHVYDLVARPQIPDEQKPDGKLFRAGPVVVMDNRQKVKHRGFTGEDEVSRALQTGIELWKNPSGSRLVAAALGHLLFELAHPFYDGNGRTGRAVLVWQLSQVLSAGTALSLSTQILSRRRDYYRAFEDVLDPLNFGEATAFVYEMLLFLRDGQRQLAASLRERARILRQLPERCRALDKADRAAIRNTVLALAQAHIYAPELPVSIPSLARSLGVRQRQARQLLEDACALGLAQRAGRRPSLYALDEQTVKELGLTDLPPIIGDANPEPHIRN